MDIALDGDDIIEGEGMETEEAAPLAPKFPKASGKQKGRGFSESADIDRYGGSQFESVADEAGTGPAHGPAKSVEGWIIIVTNVNEEACEDDLHENFAEFGDIKNLHLNLDRRTGFVKGYALIEYSQRTEADAAITGMNGAELLGQTLAVSWALSRGPRRGKGRAASRLSMD